MPTVSTKTPENKYQEDFQNILASICDEKSESPTAINYVTTGQTDTLKKVVKFGTESFFIKIGEKVENENLVYENSLFADNPLFLKRIKQFSSGSILVLPYFPSVTLEDILIKERLLLTPTRIHFLNELLYKTYHLFWAQNVSRSAVDVEEIKNYIEARVNPLYKEEKRIDFEKLFSAPVMYKKNGTKIELPSIQQMVTRVLKTFSNLNSGLSSCIIGDFQPSNILISGEDFKIIDLSNGSRDGDLALDVGKLFNFINRFHFIVELRNKIADKTKNDGPSYNKALTIKSFDYPRLVQRKLAENVEENFSAFIAKETSDFNFPDRVKLYKFVVNLITIRRHINIGVSLEPLLSVLIDSYYELETKIFNI